MHPDILDVLYQKYYHTAYIYTLSLCKRKEVAEDIVSEAFEKAFLTLDDDRVNFKYWLFVVCKNLWIDRLRKEKRNADIAIEEIQIPSLSDLPETKYMMEERNKIIYENMMSLPQNYREILSLYYYADLSLTEIAFIMKLSNSNAKTLICRARAKLKLKLEENDYEF